MSSRSVVREASIGEQNNNRVYDILYKKWRKKVFGRDEYTCQRCFNKGKYLHAHHIESWASNEELRTVKSNGITFCEKCHRQFHKEYGKKNNSREQLDEYLGILLNS